MEFSAPTTLNAAIKLYSANGGGAGLMAGGTDLLVQMRSGRAEIGHVIDLKRIPELNVLSYDKKRGLRLGAAVACDVLGAFKPAKAAYAALIEGAELIGSTQIQSRASVGGNVCNGSPAADTICSLIVLGAQCVVKGPQGKREIPARDFMVGPGKTALRKGELLVEFRIPPPPAHSASGYLRFIPRNEMDIAVVSAAANITLSANGKTCTAASVAIGAVAPTPLLVEAAGKALVGSTLDEAALEAAAAASRKAARPISDMRGTKEYRTHMAGVLTKRAIAMALQRARGA
ncbi:MAG: xanthine dehydrogenase family protein subunit M [Candidatus Lambdaproteobacteria bacterium]|nr:xanthine dehydrogenase family protein subunit M [Candidatus Lambdaproteobacteria bacterium]